MIKKAINKSLLKFGLRLQKIDRHGNLKRKNQIDPLDRNKKETLERLWTDEKFLESYVSKDRQALYELVYARAIREEALDSEKRVVDVGCGPGFFGALLFTKGFEGYFAGCDFSEEAIKKATDLVPSGTFFVHDVYSSLNEKFDTLFCMETLEHLLRADLAVQKLSDSAQKLYLTVPEGRKDSFRGHINFWSKDSFTVFLETNCPEKQVKVEEVNSEGNLLATLIPKEKAKK